MKITSAKFDTSAVDLAGCPESILPEFAFIGRSNVGKSSLLNLLSGAKDLAKVSSTPGHTKLINFFTMNGKWRMVDLPGYGYAKVTKEDRWKFGQANAEFLSMRGNLACVFVLIDSRLPPQALDLDFLEWLIGVSRPFALVFTKTDKSKPAEVKKNVAVFLKALANICAEQPPYFTSSVKTREGGLDILQFIGRSIGVGQASKR